MPRVKIDYIVSFSSEDSDNPASNLLSWDVNKKKWLCPKGEPSCSVVLQLNQAVKICSVNIGAHQAALVEVLVGRSETPNEPFQVLVPSSVFQSPSEARRADPAQADKVRSFGGEALSAARCQRWDRLRVLCSQPYNKHCKFGLSFVHVFSEDSPPTAPAPAPPATPEPAPALPARLTVPLDLPSSDEEEFRPGELFAKHLQKPKDNPDTGALIRQASSHALKNIPDSSIKLNKSPMCGAAARVRRPSPAGRSLSPGDRRRDALLYAADDARPDRRIDAVLANHDRHKQDERRDNLSRAGPSRAQPPAGKGAGPSERDRGKDESIEKKHYADITIGRKHDGESGNRKKDDKLSGNGRKDNEPSGTRQKDDEPFGIRRKDDECSGIRRKDEPSGIRRKDEPSGIRQKDDEPSKRKYDESRKRQNSDRKHDDSAESAAPHALLADVVFVLSGYENPRRARLRTAALAMGAACQRDWGPRCTHLVCAFPNTPKLRAVRAGPGGARATVVTGEWVEECARTRRRLPAQWFATEPARRVSPPPGWDAAPDSECDTDDEIEKVREKMKKRRIASPSPAPPRATPSPAPAPRAASPGDPGAAAARAQLGVSSEDGAPEADSDGGCYGGSTDEEAGPGARAAPCRLPALFAGRCFQVRAGARAAPRIERYVRAYGGLLLQEPDAGADYVVCESEEAARGVGVSGAVCVRAAWLWRCHAERRLCPTRPYTLAST